MATTVRVSERTRRRAAALAQEAGTSIGELVDRALDSYETKEFWSQTRTALTNSPAGEDEWDGVSRDGLTSD